jgi:outer membrane receptor for monomeric catechols
VDNFTDKKYVSSVVGDQVIERYYEPGAPRNWLLGVKYTIQM